MTDHRITQLECQALFGARMPLEAVVLLRTEDGTPLPEIREKLQRMAIAWRAVQERPHLPTHNEGCTVCGDDAHVYVGNGDVGAFFCAEHEPHDVAVISP